MKWYKDLYLGEKAEKAKYRVLGRVVKRKFTIDTYLIVLPQSGNNILEMVPANFLLQPYFKNKKRHSNMYVVGIAVGKQEAMEVVKTIVDEVYRETRGFNVAQYLHFGV